MSELHGGYLISPMVSRWPSRNRYIKCRIVLLWLELGYRHASLPILSLRNVTCPESVLGSTRGLLLPVSEAIYRGSLYRAEYKHKHSHLRSLCMHFLELLISCGDIYEPKTRDVYRIVSHTIRIFHIIASRKMSLSSRYSIALSRLEGWPLICSEYEWSVMIEIQFKTPLFRPTVEN